MGRCILVPLPHSYTLECEHDGWSETSHLMIKTQPKDRHTLGIGEQKGTMSPALINHAGATQDPGHLYLNFVSLR